MFKLYIPIRTLELNFIGIISGKSYVSFLCDYYMSKFSAQLLAFQNNLQLRSSGKKRIRFGFVVKQKTTIQIFTASEAV